MGLDLKISHNGIPYRNRYYISRIQPCKTVTNIFSLACTNILLLFSTFLCHSKLYKLSQNLVFFIFSLDNDIMVTSKRCVKLFSLTFIPKSTDSVAYYSQKIASSKKFC